LVGKTQGGKGQKVILLPTPPTGADLKKGAGLSPGPKLLGNGGVSSREDPTKVLSQGK
jgi:hypothetical protein